MALVPPPTEVSRLLGRRVVVRYRIGVRDGRPLFSDAVGELSATAGALLVHTRRGPVRIDPAAVVAAREVPPARPRRPSWAAVAELEQRCADAWPALVEVRLGAWRLRAAGGFTSRANSALTVGEPDRPVPDALAAVRAFAAEHAVPPRVQVPVGSPWEKAVATAGWELTADHSAGREVVVLVGDLATLSDGDAGPAVVEDEPTPEWWRLILGGGGEPTPAQRHVLAAAPTVGFGLSIVDGQAIGAVRACVVGDHLHVARLVVAPPQRRAGLGRVLLAAAARWGAARGARWWLLQVAVGNAGATAFYHRLGLLPHHRYRYRVPPARG